MLITHAHYTIKMVQIFSVDHINVAHQQLTQPELKEGSLRLKQIQRRLEIEEVGISTHE